MTDSDYTPSTPDALPPGFRFDELEIQDVIQTSHTDILYHALDRELERPVFIREYMPRALALRGEDMRLVLRSKQDSAVFAAGLNAFVQQARQLARFTHPNLMLVLRFWQHNDTAYILTPRYDGITLAELHQQQPDVIDEAWTLQRLPMLCSALATLHHANALHRNISLKSIQIEESGQPLLLDVAVAHAATGEHSETSKLLLHPGFTPLEQYADASEDLLGPWTDIYALGAVLYTLITGSPPPASVARSIQDSCTPLVENPPPGYSPALLQAVDRALALKPEDRPQSITEFAALAGITVGDTGQLPAVKKTGTMLVPVEEPSAVAPTLWQRFKTPAQIAAGVVVGIIAGALIFGSSHSDTETAAAASSAQPAPAPEAKVASAPASGPIARIYIRMSDADRLQVNGKTQEVAPAASGFAYLQLPAGKYEFTLQNGSQRRSETLTVATPGTWLINPQG
ncbi:protein kinase [Pseudescherichia vulneris]|uniref:serine/threonine protein kinase n=1 Tax=Pseudescherichia vulneris TaxID=566 RepID=UPI00227CC2BA|nr:protein kinase [Pseudescherichia vulneris]WAH52646.1 protein kinase [Pseudescherichia vulneris]